jgi:rhodanese-related sulfurtransferase
MRQKQVFLILVLVFFHAFGLTGQSMSSGYRLMLKGLLSRSVPELTVEDLSERLTDHTTVYTILDAREPKETAVSTLNNAQPVGFDHFDLNSVAHLDKSQPIVVYCSVGYRSEKVTEKLIAAGFKEVYNLYGGIFEWVNQGHEVVDALGAPTKRVHAYSRTWGVWLKKGKKVY